IVIDDSNPNQIIVLRVFPRTPAYYAGIQAGDVITTVNGQQVASLSAFTQLLTQATGPLALQVSRAGQTRELQLSALGSEDASVRTALRPNFDGGVSSNASANAQGGATVTTPGINATAPGINATVPGTTTGAAGSVQGQL